MPRLSELAEILIKGRVVPRPLWDEAETIGGDDLALILDHLAEQAPGWWEGPSPAPPGLTEYQREIIQSRFQENELDLLRRDLVLNQFLLLEKLGHGGQGEVYRARQLSPARYAAVKILIRDTESRRKRFEQEARAMIKIQHPSVARFYLYERIRDAYGDPTDEYLIAMEFVNGTDLQRLVRKSGPIPWTSAVRWGADLLGGLEVIHESGFIHRDVKPENVMIVGSNAGPDASRAKLLDFGAANRVGEPVEMRGTNRRVFVGTMEYAAPEQWAGEMVVGSDLYALGGTLFYILACRHAFQKDRREPGSFMNAHLHDEVPDLLAINPNIPPELNRLIRQMMAKDHTERGTAAELLKEFKRLMPRESGVSAATPPPPAPLSGQAKPKTTDAKHAQEVKQLKSSLVAPPEANTLNPMARVADQILTVLERIFIPGHLLTPFGATIGIPERVLALLRRPLVIAILAVVLAILSFCL